MTKKKMFLISLILALVIAAVVADTEYVRTLGDDFLTYVPVIFWSCIAFLISLPLIFTVQLVFRRKR